MSLRDLILNNDDIGSKIVDVKQWGVKVELRTMTAAARSEMMAEAMDEEGKVDLTTMWPMVIVASAFDPETGDKLFTNEDIPALQAKAAGAIEKLGTEAMALSGMGGNDADEAGKES